MRSKDGLAASPISPLSDREIALELDRRLAQNKHMALLPQCDRVEVALLGKIGNRQEEGQFPIIPYKTTAAIKRACTVRGSDAEAVAEIWRSLDFGYKQRMCHFPEYGLKFFAGDKMLLQTSVCWGCRNFYVDDRWVGFDAKSESGQRLLSSLQQILPRELPPK